MDSKLAAESGPAAKRHNRNTSYGRAMPRRSTKGPLDADDPLAPTPSSLETSQYEASNSPLPQSPRRPSPQVVDLSFLLHPSIYHSIPIPLIAAPPPPPSISSADSLQRGHYHHAAISSVARLTQPPPPPQDELFSLIYVRLASLVKLNHIPLATSEAKALEDIPSPSNRPDSGHSILPWNLRVLLTRLQGGGVAGLYALARDAKAAYRRGMSGEERALWRARIREVGWMTVNALAEEVDMVAAIAQARGMSRLEEEEGVWRKRMVLLYLKIGDVEGARRVLEGIVDGDGSKALEALVQVCEGEYGAAARVLEEMEGKGKGPRNNLALTRFYTGDVGETVRLLEEIVQEGDAEKGPIFNLATCFELMSERGARERKERLIAKIREGSHASREELGRTNFKL